MAAQVNERLLDAATEVFLKYGFEGATFEKIAKTAGSGKATIYARYAGKEELFNDVIKRSIGQSLRFIDDVPLTTSMKERLTLTAQAILDNCLTPEVVALMRVIIAEAPRFPGLARLADDFGRKQAIKSVIRVMMAAPEDKPSKAVMSESQAIQKAEQFLHLIFAPMQLRALMGENLAVLKREIPLHISSSISILYR